MTKEIMEQFITERTNHVSECLDHPNSFGIYPTTKLYNALDETFNKLANEHAKWQSIDYSEWLSNNRWSFNKEDRFWYVFGTNKEELGSTLYDFFCWMNDEVNPFIQLENGRYCQACGNSTTWSYDELLKMFKEQNSNQ